MGNPIIPEVLEDEARLPEDLRRLKSFATLLDGIVTIPGTSRRVGIDAAIGLIPGFGDAIGAILSSFIVIGALRHRVPRGKVGRMIANILVDSGIGAIPVVGDIFDALWTPNLDNMALLLRHRDRHRPPRSAGSIVMAVVGVALLILVIAGIGVGVGVALVMKLLGG